MKIQQLLTKLILITLTLFMATSVCADMLVIDIDPSDFYTNPQWVTPSNWSTEEAWLEGLLGVDTDVSYLGKDEKVWNDGIWSEEEDSPSVPWTYAVLKYGVGKPRIDNPDHWAIIDGGDNMVDLTLAGLPALGKLSHITYFGDTAPVPEPATILLLASGLAGFAGFRKRLKKR